MNTPTDTAAPTPETLKEWVINNPDDAAFELAFRRYEMAVPIRSQVHDVLLYAPIISNPENDSGFTPHAAVIQKPVKRKAPYKIAAEEIFRRVFWGGGATRIKSDDIEYIIRKYL